jgi:phage baseplate assembly protein W
MANRIYNIKEVSTVKNSQGQTNSVPFLYKGFNSRRPKTKFKEYDVDLVKQDLLNHFNIRRGEKLENPSFGTSIWDMLYEPMNDENIQAVRDDVEIVLNRDPRIQILEIKVDAVENGIRVEADLLYKNINLREKIAFDFENKRIPK